MRCKRAYRSRSPGAELAVNLRRPPDPPVAPSDAVGAVVAAVLVPRAGVLAPLPAVVPVAAAHRGGMPRLAAALAPLASRIVQATAAVGETRPAASEAAAPTLFLREAFRRRAKAVRTMMNGACQRLSRERWWVSQTWLRHVLQHHAPTYTKMTITAMRMTQAQPKLFFQGCAGIEGGYFRT